MRKWVGYHSRIDYKDKFYDCEVLLLDENEEYGKIEDGSYHIFEHIFIDKHHRGCTICLDEKDHEKYGKSKKSMNKLLKEWVIPKLKYIGYRERRLGEK